MFIQNITFLFEVLSSGQLSRYCLSFSSIFLYFVIFPFTKYTHNRSQINRSPQEEKWTDDQWIPIEHRPVKKGIPKYMKWSPERDIVIAVDFSLLGIHWEISFAIAGLNIPEITARRNDNIMMVQGPKVMMTKGVKKFEIIIIKVIIWRAFTGQ